MPVILPEEHHAKWLGEIEDGDLKELLKPYPADQMKMWPVSQRVRRSWLCLTEALEWSLYHC